MNKPRMTRQKIFPAVTLFLLLFIAACGPTISQFSQHAYEATTSLKVDALLLMDKASEDYGDHQKEAETLQRNLMKLKEYERNRPVNGITLEMWKLLTDSGGNLLGGFLERWENEGPQNPAYIKQKKQQVGKAFDQIAQLESRKIKPDNIQ